MNIAAKTFKDFVSALKQASTEGFNKPVQINYQYEHFLAELQEGEVFGYKGKLDKLSGDETDHLFDVLEDLVSWDVDSSTMEAEESVKKEEKEVDKILEKEDIVIEVVKPAKPKRTSRKKT